MVMEWQRFGDAHPAACTCRGCTNQRTRPKADRGVPRPVCELEGHRYVLDIQQSRGTLACFRCSWSENIGTIRLQFPV